MNASLHKIIIFVLASIDFLSVENGIAQENPTKAYIAVYGTIFNSYSGKSLINYPSYSYEQKNSYAVFSPSIAIGIQNEHRAISIELSTYILTVKTGQTITRTTQFGPFLRYYRFFPITSRVVYSPAVRVGFTIGGSNYENTVTNDKQHSNLFYSSLNFSPFAFAFKYNKRLNILFQVANVSAYFSRATTLNNSSVIQSRNSVFGMFAGLSNISFGIQRSL